MLQQNRDARGYLLDNHGYEFRQHASRQTKQRGLCIFCPRLHGRRIGVFCPVHHAKSKHGGRTRLVEVASRPKAQQQKAAYQDKSTNYAAGPEAGVVVSAPGGHAVDNRR